MKVTGMGTVYSMLCSSKSALGASERASDRPPNFIVIMADDIGAKELGCYGNTDHKTPVLDKLAESGVKFETGFATPVCHPTRFMIMTGQYGAHNGIYNFSGKRGGPDPEAPEENIANHVTFAQLLKPCGYATALSGKWQLSGSQPNLIYECGFDEYCVWAFSNYLKEEDIPKYKGRNRYWNPSIIKNTELIDTKEDEYGPDKFADFAIDFMKRKKDQPFFVYYPMCLTHGPWVPTPDSVKPGDDLVTSSKDNFKAMVEYTDKIVGRIVSALDEMGLRDNTIIFFTGDNGTGGDGKAQGNELGARVPMIVNCPGIVKKRGSTMELTDLSDIMPTLADFAVAALPTDRPIDGKSYAAFLRGETETTRDWIFSYIADRRIIRTTRWLLEDNSPLHYGHLFDCGDSRDGTGYKEVTDSNDPEVIAVKKEFDAILAKLPAPLLPREGRPNEPKEGSKKRKKDTQTQEN